VPAREVLVHPDPRLKQVARLLEPGERALAERMAADLVDTMRAGPRCVGVAAPQIGELVRIVAVDCSTHPKATDHHGLLVMVNPIVVEATGSEIGREGCLSIPEITANVRRATAVVVEAVDPAGAPLRVATAGFEARALQHEIDHLDGVLILDRVASLDTDVFRRRRR
jgi:peptide deformylase